MRTIGRLIRVVLCACLLPSSPKLQASSLDAWILAQIEEDEQHLVWAIRGQEGYSVELLPSAKWYQPFFLEQPASVEDVAAHNLAELDNYFKQQREFGLLEGGYLLRIRFDQSRALYRLSSGSWNDHWFDPSLRKEFEVAPLKVWAGGGRDGFTYATILSGVPPRLVEYSFEGNMQKEIRFDLSAPDVASDIKETEKMYSGTGTPALEMVSLGEYLAEGEPSWRSIEMSSLFNFRNQHKRLGETHRINQLEKLTRKRAMGKLLSRIRQGEVGIQPSDAQVENDNAAGGAGVPFEPEPSLQKQQRKSGRWPLLLGVVAALLLAGLFVRALMLILGSPAKRKEKE